jgi:RimJ/RimL family protein N-acetyltransferase/8-oxo-dGTP pyrophosphatase MutT (NUDIX family)
VTAAALHTARLDLVPATLAHVEAELADDRAALERMLAARVPEGWPPGLYDRDAMRFFRAQLVARGEAASGWYGWYAIAHAADGEPATLVGAAGYLGPPSADGEVEIGYSVVESFRGRGYATEIARALAERALALPGVRRVAAEAAATNVASRRVLERAGFVLAGAGREPGHERWRREPPARVSAAPREDARDTATPGPVTRDAAVLVPLFREDAAGTWRLVVVRRSDWGIHGGQLAFPGGSRSKGDASLFATAVREAQEEIGLPADAVRMLAALPTVETRVSGFRISPFLAIVRRPEHWAIDTREIAEILEPALPELLAPGARQYATDLLPPSRGVLRLPYFPVGPHRLWGASEAILAPLLRRIAAGEWPEVSGGLQS